MVYIFFMYIFNCMLCPNNALLFFIICVCNALSLNYIGYESDRNNMKATGDVISLYINVNVINFFADFDNKVCMKCRV